MKFFQKGFSNILIIVIIAVIVLIGAGIGGYFYYQKWQRDRFNEQNPNIAPPQFRDDTSTWQTYRNEKYGFEMRYPESYFKNVNMNPATYGSDLYFDDKYENLFVAYEGENNMLPDGRFSLEISYVPYSTSSVKEIVKERINPYKQDLVGFNYPLYTNDNQPIAHYGLVSLITYSNVDDKYLCEEDVATIPFKESKSILFSIKRCKMTTLEKIDYNETNVGSGVILTAADAELRDQILSTFKFVPSTNSGQVSPASKDIIYFNNPAYSGWNEAQMKANCQSRGGAFNPCGSACLDPAEVCIQVCAPRCEFKER